MIPFALTACGLWSSAKITLRFLQFFQQEEYESKRFLQWWLRSRSIEPRISLAAFCGVCLLALDDGLGFGWSWLLGPVLGFSMIILGAAIPLTPSKKPLKVTSRIQRLIALSIMIQAAVIAGLASLIDSDSAWTGTLCGIIYFVQLQCIPLWIVCANTCAIPIEGFIRFWYRRDAEKQMRRCAPSVIGITGSYGKTSTKCLVAQVLRSRAPTLMTPGSVNTLMGITRVIREELLSDHRYFVVEMGAYRPGSIRSLCKLTPPQVAVLTEVGIAHLERFGSIEIIAQAKAELPEALGPDGYLVYNADNPYCRLIASRMKCRTFSYGRDASITTPDLWIQRADQLPHGIEVSFFYQGKSINGLIPIHGMHQAHNAAAALGVGICLGIPLVQGLAALHYAAPTPHRCSVTQVDGITWIDDSYNSNPNGFRNALEVLRALPGKRGILVTPGMVELGDAHSQEHRALALGIHESCEQVCLIAPERISSLKEALEEAGFDQENLHTFNTFAAAREWLLQHLRPGDKVLLENDLPDLHERSSAFDELGRGK